ncbi:type II toxin-antitoxin system RelE/ParE family toxin [Providencia stuartii]
MEKKVNFIGDAEKELDKFPHQVKEKFVQDLMMMSYGMDPLSSVKSLSLGCKGVCELRKNGRPAYRLVFVIIDDVIHVLHVFSKTSSGTDKKHEDTIKLRFKKI